MDLRYDDRGKYFTPRIAKDAVNAFVRTTDQLIVGTVYVRPGNRLTDDLNSETAPFLAMTDVRVFRAADESPLLETSFLLVAFRDILLIGELDAMADIRPTPWQTPQGEPEPRLSTANLGVRVDERGKYFAVRVPKDALHAVLHTGELAVVGYLHIRPERRLKDEIDDDRMRFIPVTDARIYRTTDDTLLYHASFLLAGRHHVRLVAPVAALARAHPAPWLPLPADEGPP